ncbi:MAG: membrane protein insertion efficiency factor YidD [Pedosphaera sp.]|nr:membrane protein insertion efficiency factor YidD [Pedosphaera sp.]
MSVAQAILILMVRVYRYLLSPAKTLFFGPLGRCRFTPSCSDYGLQALKSHGAALGTWLCVKRVCRCHPWGGCGHDPVPLESPFQTSKIKSQLTPFRSLQINAQSSTDQRFSGLNG